MLYSEMRKKEVINMRDCRKLGRVVLTEGRRGTAGKNDKKALFRPS